MLKMLRTVPIVSDVDEEAIALDSCRVRDERGESCAGGLTPGHDRSTKISSSSVMNRPIDE
jgi:hypothetical protein